MSSENYTQEILRLGEKGSEIQATYFARDEDGKLVGSFVASGANELIALSSLRNEIDRSAALPGEVKVQAFAVIKSAQENLIPKESAALLTAQGLPGEAKTSNDTTDFLIAATGDAPNGDAPSTGDSGDATLLTATLDTGGDADEVETEDNEDPSGDADTESEEVSAE